MLLWSLDPEKRSCLNRLSDATARSAFIFQNLEGQMARDISKMTFKKLIQFRKSILFFRNAPRNLPVDLPRTRYLRGMRFANPDFFRVSLFTFWTCLAFWEANLRLACTPALFGSTFWPFRAAYISWLPSDESCVPSEVNGSRDVGWNPCTLRPSQDDAR